MKIGTRNNINNKNIILIIIIINIKESHYKY